MAQWLPIETARWFLNYNPWEIRIHMNRVYRLPKTTSKRPKKAPKTHISIPKRKKRQTHWTNFTKVYYWKCIFPCFFPNSLLRCMTFCQVVLHWNESYLEKKLRLYNRSVISFQQLHIKPRHCRFQMSHEKPWLGYIGNYTTQLYRDYDKPLPGVQPFALEKWWLEDDPFLLARWIFKGFLLSNFGRV